MVRFLPVLFCVFSALLAPLLPSAALAADAGSQRLYVHPDRLFILRVPDDAIVRRGTAPGTAEAPVVVRSEDGYVLSVEARAHAGLPDDEKSAAPVTALKVLEGIFVGDGKAFQKRAAPVYGGQINYLPAVRGQYAGPAQNGIIAVARGAKHDFVFMFFAPPGVFNDVSWIFERYLLGFEAAAQERAAGGLPETIAAFQPRNGHFENPKLGYAVQLPETWTARFVPPYNAVFAPPAPDAVAGVKAGIQNVLGSTAITVLADWRERLSATVDAPDFGTIRGIAVLTPAGAVAVPWQEVTYAYRGVRYKQYAVAVSRGESGGKGRVTHLFSYDAPLERFDRYSDPAGEILRSLRLLP